MFGTNRSSVEQRLLRAWYGDRWWLVFLRPLSWLFDRSVTLRRRRLQAKFQGAAFAVPVAVVGNISVGGSGKTPFIIALVKALATKGIVVGIVSRGYGGRAKAYPLSVSPDTKVDDCGDEPRLLALELAHLNCPIVVDPKRVAAVQHLLASHSVDIVLSDDGLQHYRMHRDIEIALIDGHRGLGNGRTLPAGPLREPPQRLSEVDFTLINGPSDIKGIDTDGLISLQPSVFRHLASNKCIAPIDWDQSKAVHAVAAIGNPQRFAASLESLGLEVSLHGKNDHKVLTRCDLNFGDQLPVIITGKDAVKLVEPAPENLWVLEVEMVLDTQFVDCFIKRANLDKS
ncbi:MAG: tetraacyldisaccharide 4'-kinase [Porticoccaceae bacterium]|nr:tetraacyldisaccharide 4'-kinase [Porticoccaceae bacterium]MDG1311859.1 tetraacyldisaccharide 4'-kinase [Porticoccaceae bacterium]